MLTIKLIKTIHNFDEDILWFQLFVFWPRSVVISVSDTVSCLDRLAVSQTQQISYTSTNAWLLQTA